MDISLSDVENEKFVTQFTQKYLQNGFSIMPKREIDILVFHLLRQTKQFKGKSIYELSNLFRMSEQKVKSYILEGALRHTEINHKVEVSRVVERYINNLQKFDIIGGYCEVALDDPVERREFEQAVKTSGHHVEHGINKDILKIKPIRFLEIILQNVEKGEKEFITLVKIVIADKKKQQEILDKSLTFRDKINKLGEEIGDKASLIALLSGAGALLM